MIAERDRLVLLALSSGALLFGCAVELSPRVTVVLLAVPAMFAIALRLPLTVLVALLTLTAIVPYELQHSLAIGATGNSPGLLLSDALLLGGLFRALLILPHAPLEPRRTLSLGLMACFVAAIFVQAVRGLALGANPSVVGAEFRCLLGFATLLIAMPILTDEHSRRRLLGWFLALGLALGVWGLLQWTLHVSFGDAGDLGVRQGVSLTTAGSGQLQGGLFAYPVAVLLALAMLASGKIRSAPTRRLTAVVLLINCADLLLTYERTFWLATLVGALLIFLRAGAAARRRAARWAPLGIIFLLVAIALTPTTFTTAEQRLVSVGQYSTDKSVHYRVVESEHVLARIRAHPLVGSSLGSTIYWGRPEEGVEPSYHNYSHDGYLWLTWKLGIPAAALLVLVMIAAALWRAVPDGDQLFAAVRLGAQASIVMLLIVSITFPVFNTLAITSLAGVLLAIATMPVAVRGAAPVGER